MNSLTRYVRSGILALVILSSLPMALAKDWNPPDHGFLINLSTPNGIAQQSGQSAIITGTISSPDVKLNKNRNLLDVLKDDDVQVKAFFPDLTTEVTSSVAIRNQGGNLLLSFQTPNLKKEDLNQFVIQVDHLSPNTRALQILQAKIDVRICALNKLIAFLTSRHIEPRDTQLLTQFKDRLKRISDRINEKLSKNPEVLAEVRFPLQIDNQIAAASSSSILVKDFKLSISYDIGSAIQGQKVQINAFVTNTRDGNKNDRYQAQFSWAGAIVGQVGPQALAENSSLIFQYQTASLLPGANNEFAIDLFEWDKKKNKKSDLIAHQSFDEPVAADQTAPVWLAGSTPDAQHHYVKDMQAISAQVRDDFGLINSSSIRALLNGVDVTSQLLVESPDQNHSFNVSGAISALAEGLYAFSLEAKDLAGHSAFPNPLSSSFRVDRTPPGITLGVQDHLITNNPSLNLPISVLDLSPTSTTVTLNGSVISTSSALSFNAPLTLTQGANLIEVTSIDAAGNPAEPVKLVDIVLDTAAPILSNPIPADGAIVQALTFPVSGQANESLSYAKVNGALINLSQDKKSFSGFYTAQIEGPTSLNFEVADLVGNIATRSINVQILLNVLNANLLSVIPAPDRVHLLIKGAPGATRPGVTVNATSGFFNNGSAMGAADGSFTIQLQAFTQATLTATDSSIGRTDTATVTFGTGGKTYLSGVVKDTSGLPLPGAKVSLANTQVTPVFTDGSGVFIFNDPVTGDQTLVVDGSSIPASIPPTRKFSSTRVSVSIGLTQSNVLPRPIYLAPILLDGSATNIDVAAGGQVTDLHAPGVKLDIPGSSAHFPTGSQSGEVSMATIPVDFSTIAPMPFAVPKKVVALEPSGMSFSEPAQLTLPNFDELPPGVELVILSMDSRKGIWTVDGVATVSNDGSSVITKPGMGITHFSNVYATPIGPTIKQIGAKDVPGANTFDGALTTAVKLPSYKSLGQDIAPSLIYRSSWAKPTALVTNMFDIPVSKLILDTSFQTGRHIKVEKCLGPICKSKEFDYYSTVSTQVNAWFTPEKIISQFFTQGVTSEPYSFEGVPNRAAISYSVDLKDQNTGKYLRSGAYPYNAHYEVHLKETIVTSRKVTSWGSIAEVPQVSQDIDPATEELKEVFPQDMNGPIYIQNKSESEAGKGWMIAGVQKITDPSASRILIEEGDGSIASYSLNNSIDTLINFNTYGGNVFQAADISQWPNIYFTDSDGSNYYRANLLSGHNSAASAVGSVPVWSGEYAGNDNFESTNSFFGSKFYWCEVLHLQYFYSGKEPQGILPLANGSIFVTDSNRHTVSQMSGGVGSVVAGFVGSPPTVILRGPNANSELSANMFNFCTTTSGMSCSPIFGLGGFVLGPPGQNPDQICVQSPGHQIIHSFGPFPAPGFNGDGAALAIQLNRPMGISNGPRPNTFVIADSGNNRVRLIDTVTGSITTVAGNNTTLDSGDGGPATQAGIFHPRGVIYDAVGNLYISTENGYIRKVDTNGVISTFAGNPNGTVGDNIPAHQVILRRPYGMAVDNNQGYLYVADVDANVVRRIDFQTKTALTVAGNGLAGYNGDRIPALNATLSAPKFLGLDDQGNLLIVDSGNQRARRVIFQSTNNGVLAYGPTAQDHSTLLRNGDGSFTRSYRNGNQVFFDSNGRQVSTSDRVGRQTLYSYDGAGRLIAFTDAAGKVTQYNYSGQLLSSITDPANKMTRFNYDASGNLVLVTFPDGSTRNYGYSPEGLMLSETNERGITTQYAYNEWNRLKEVIRPDATKVEISDSGSSTVANNYTSGNVGQLKSTISGSNQVFDGIKDAKSIETKFSKDYQGYVSTIIDGSGNTTTVQRDEKGKPTLITRPDGTSVSYTYDPSTDDLLSQTDSATGITTSQTFDTYGNLVTQKNGRGYTSSNQFNPVNGLLLAKIDPLSQITSYGYNNPFKLVTSVTNTLGKTTSSTYDASGNLSSVTDPLSHVTSYVRDSAGNVISATNSNNKTTQYEYDTFNRLTAVITPKGERTEYSYLPTGELAQIKDPLGNLTKFEYNLLGQLNKKTDSLGNVTQRFYDANGNLAQEIDPNGNVKSFQYDSLNQLVKKTLPDNTIDLTYDVRGRLTQTKNFQSQIDLGYDVAGRLITAQSQGLGSYASLPNVTLGFGYDANNNRQAMLDPVGQTSYSYDPLDRLTSLSNPRGENYSFDFDAGSRLASINRPGSTSQLVFDNANFLSSITHSSHGSTIAAFNYLRDNLGNVTQITRDSVVRNIAYDPNNQVISASNPEAPAAFQAETFSYDAISNRTSDQAGSYTYDQKAQRLIEDYRYLYLYDNNGNLITKQAKGFTGEVTNYTYSSENQLLGFKVYVPGNPSPVKEADYAYDALGRRTQKQVIDHTASVDPYKSFTKRYVYDGQEILLEYDGSNRLLARYTHSTLRTDDVLAVDVTSAGVDAKVALNSGSYQYLKDQLGTVTDIADTSGNRVLHYVYSAYGVLLGIQDATAADVSAAPPVNTAYTFTGREYDSESGFYYYRARYYDSSTGRFLQKDPEPGKLEVSSTVVNSYIYVSQDPFNLADPTGKGIFSFIESLFIGIVGAIAAFFVTPLAISAIGISSITGVGGAVLGTFAGAISGAIAGALAGGLVGGIINAAHGKSFTDGFWAGAAIGAVTGGTTGALSGFGAWQSGQGISVAGGVSVAYAGGCIIQGSITALLSAITYSLAIAPEPTLTTKIGAVATGAAATYLFTSTLSCLSKVNVVPENAS